MNETASMLDLADEQGGRAAKSLFDDSKEKLDELGELLPAARAMLADACAGLDDAEKKSREVSL